MEKIEKKLSQFDSISKIDSTTYIPVISGNPLLNKKLAADYFSNRYGSNYVILNANGTSTENGDELLSEYIKPLYGSFSLYSNIPVNRVVSYSGNYYKSINGYTGSTEIQQYVPSENNTDYWDFLNSYIYQDIDIEQIQTDGSNSYWEYLGESYEPNWNEYDYDGNGFKSFEYDEIVYGYNSSLDAVGYFRCIQAITLGDTFSDIASIGQIFNDNQSDEDGVYKVFVCISDVNLYPLTINNTSKFENIGDYYPYLTASTNRYKLILPPGTYNCQLNVDTQYVDISSLTGEIDVRISGISVTANDVRLNGLESYGSRFAIGDNLSLLVCEKCKSMISRSFCVDPSTVFGSSKIVSGTFIDCIGDGSAFSTYEKASGTFIRCTGGTFARGNEASGYFEGCTGSNTCFGGGNSIFEYQYSKATGTFINCKQKGLTNHKAFGYVSSSGRFENCTSETPAFSPILDGSTVGQQITFVDGTYINCQAPIASFGGGYAGQGYGLFTGLAVNCIGGLGSFGGYKSGAGVSGTLINCVIRGFSKFNNTNGSFKTTPVSRPITFTSGSISITLVKHNLKHGDVVKFFKGDLTGDTLPSNISGNTAYYVVSPNTFPTNTIYPDTFSIALTDTGTPITISDAGIGISKVKYLTMINCVDNNNNIINVNHANI